VAPDRSDVRWPAEPLGRIGAPVIQDQSVQAAGVRVGECLEKDLEHLGLEVGEFETDALAGGRRDRGIDIKPFEDVLDRPDGLDPARGEAAAHGRQAQATFVLSEPAQRLGRLRRDDALELLQTGHLNLRDGLRVCLVCLGCATLSFV
jgi:hypothetical protein